MLVGRSTSLRQMQMPFFLLVGVISLHMASLKGQYSRFQYVAVSIGVLSPRRQGTVVTISPVHMNEFDSNAIGKSSTISKALGRAQTYAQEF